MNTIPTTTTIPILAAPTVVDAPPGGPAAVPMDIAPNGVNDPVLVRLRALQEELILKEEILKAKDLKIHDLSADKRKAMQEMIDSGIELWCTQALKGVSDEHLKQFKDGLKTLAAQADVSNSAWEIVCNASKTHADNVNQIEQLVKENNRLAAAVNGARGFTDEASRMSTPLQQVGGKRVMESMGDDGRNVRGRGNDLQQPTGPIATGGAGDAWDDFAKMMRSDYTSMYR